MIHDINDKKQTDGSVTMSTVYHAEAKIEFGNGMQYLWYEDGREYLTTYAYLGLPNHHVNRKWHPKDAFLHCYFQCKEPYVPAVVAAQLMERVLRGCLLFAHTVLRVGVSNQIEFQETSASEHPFFDVDAALFEPEPQQYTLQPESEGTARLIGTGPLSSKVPVIDGIEGNPRSRIDTFVSSYQKIPTRTRRLIEFDIRGNILLVQTFYEEAFLNFYKVYESFRHLLRQRFPLEYTRLRRIKIKADQQKERANTIARLVELSINRNVRDDDFQKKLDKIELHRDQVAAHWNFREHDDEWSLPFNAVAVASFLSHRIVLWEIEQELGDL